MGFGIGIGIGIEIGRIAALRGAHGPGGLRHQASEVRTEFVTQTLLAFGRSEVHGGGLRGPGVRDGSGF
ncbi:hypothetical protein GCM10010394_57410 [Streptomyces crystallinus]|uniref:Uncharacterized protein n=1 Tax=Streptomyces crystallinus TaxID=68191 RepID=A0ABP3S0U9_9ACTN